MFKKKKEITLPKLAYFTIEVNLEKLRDWVNQPRKIEPQSSWDWRHAEKLTYKITILPTDPFTFYHNAANEFSANVGGLDLVGSPIDCLEWDWNQSYFYVNACEPRKTIFCISIDEIFYLLRNGRNASQTAGRDKEVISLNENELFDEVLRDRSLSAYVAYSNELASLSVVCASASDLVNY
ncbi:MAG: hypothetical protein MI976_14985 [Pseudomonadales bacterium]|nr:hypothetical protein [Pseudomonadales bacterium]